EPSQRVAHSRSSAHRPHESLPARRPRGHRRAGARSRRRRRSRRLRPTRLSRAEARRAREVGGACGRSGWRGMNDPEHTPLNRRQRVFAREQGISAERIAATVRQDKWETVLRPAKLSRRLLARALQTIPEDERDYIAGKIEEAKRWALSYLESGGPVS